MSEENAEPTASIIPPSTPVKPKFKGIRRVNRTEDGTLVGVVDVKTIPAKTEEEKQKEHLDRIVKQVEERNGGVKLDPEKLKEYSELFNTALSDPDWDTSGADRILSQAVLNYKPEPEKIILGEKGAVVAKEVTPELPEDGLGFVDTGGQIGKTIDLKSAVKRGMNLEDVLPPPEPQE
jgi:hypothetical protein